MEHTDLSNFQLSFLPEESSLASNLNFKKKWSWDMLKKEMRKKGFGSSLRFFSLP